MLDAMCDCTGDVRFLSYKLVVSSFQECYSGSLARRGVATKSIYYSGSRSFRSEQCL